MQTAPVYAGLRTLGTQAGGWTLSSTVIGIAGPMANVGIATATLNGVNIVLMMAQPGGNTPYKGRPSEEIDPQKVDVYRGGTSLEVKPTDVKIKNGMVQPTHGVSLDTDPSGLVSFGGAHRVRSIPAALKIIQRGTRSATHFEIVPRKPMSLEQFQQLLAQVVLE